MTDPGASADIRRLADVIACQQRELAELREKTSAHAVTQLAKGVLMERLGCSSAEAAEQLIGLAREAGVPVAEMAAELINEAPHHVSGRQQGEQPSSGVVAWLAEAAAELADDGRELATALLEQTLAPLGAAAVALWVLEPEGSLRLLGQAGFGPLEESRWRYLPPGMDCPAQRVAHRGSDIWWSAGPPGGQALPLMGRWAGGARAVLALRDTRAALVGVMETCWQDPLADLPDRLRWQLAATADSCGRIVGIRRSGGALVTGGDQSVGGEMTWLLGLLGGLLESVLVTHAVRDGEGRVTDFRIDYASESLRDPAGRGARELTGRSLLEAFPAAAHTGSLFDRAVAALTTAAPQRLTGPVTSALAHAAGASVLDIRIAKLFDGVVISWWRADEASRLSTLLEHAQRLGRIGGWEEDVITGDVEYTDSARELFGLTGMPLEDMSAATVRNLVVEEDVPALARFRDTLLQKRETASMAFRVVRPDDASLRHMRALAEPVTDATGRVVAIRGVLQDVSAQYHTHVALTASEQRAEDEHRLALRLQEAIMPPAAHPVDTAGIDVAVRYRPAASQHLVGGDWYDAIVLPTKDVLLVVGDIAGHGIDAVTGMVAVRNCLRGLAITGSGPAELLSWLNSATYHLSGNTTGTVVCGLYNPDNRVLRWARAGHLPPVLVRDAIASALPLPHGPLLGLDPDSSYQEATTPLRLSDALLFFTDGLIERRGVSIDTAMDTFVRSVSGPAVSAANYADHVLTCAVSDTGDDACLVAVRIC